MSAEAPHASSYWSPEDAVLDNTADNLLDEAVSGLPPGVNDLEPLMPPLPLAVSVPNKKAPIPTKEVHGIRVFPDPYDGMVIQDTIGAREESPETDRQEYEDYFQAGKKEFARALETDKEKGLETAADSYMLAKDLLIKALWKEDVRHGTDSAIPLQIGTCLEKLSESRYARERYKSLQSRYRSRAEIWKEAAKHSFEWAAEIVLGETVDTEVKMSSDELAASVVIAVNGLNHIGAQSMAKEVLTKGSEVLKSKNASGELTHIVESHAELPQGKVVTEELQEAADAALVDFATGSHKVIKVAA